jgi:hypothetical protein
MTDERKRVLVWVSQEFLHAGMLRIVQETGLLDADMSEDRVAEAVELAGGCALTGLLIEAQTGAGVWIAPEGSPGLELMIPWGFVRGMVTAESPKTKQILGLANLVKAALIKETS